MIKRIPDKIISRTTRPLLIELNQCPKLYLAHSKAIIIIYDIDMKRPRSKNWPKPKFNLSGRSQSLNRSLIKSVNTTFQSFITKNISKDD